MTTFSYQNGVMHADGIDLREIASKVETPFYCYSASQLRTNYEFIQNNLADLKPMICYALKANSNQSVLRILANLGAGADVVSEGELRRALKAGIPAERIVFSGVGKKATEMRFALEVGIHCFNVESEPELHRLSCVASDMGLVAPISLRINPDVDARTHAKISTGKSENKFGIPFVHAIAAYDLARSLPGLSIQGVDMHIGSQITQIDAFDKAFARLAELIEKLRNLGHQISHVDVGGGLGIPYHSDEEGPDITRYAEAIRRHIVPLDCALITEPGRLLVGNIGVLVTEVLYIKEGDGKNFVIVDGAMNDLVRPTLYEAWHEIVQICRSANHKEKLIADVVGPVCETGDYFGSNRQFQDLTEGDLLAVMTVGAYGAVQSGTYNTRALVPELLVDGTQWSIIRSRQSIGALIDMDQVPSWI